MELLTVSIRWLEGTSQVNSIAAVPRVKVSADGHGVVSHAGVGMLREVAGLTGLSTLVTVALADGRADAIHPRFRGFRPGLAAAITVTARAIAPTTIRGCHHCAPSQ